MYPEYCLWLVRCGISSVSLSMDVLIPTLLYVSEDYADSSKDETEADALVAG